MQCLKSYVVVGAGVEKLCKDLQLDPADRKVRLVDVPGDVSEIAYNGSSFRYCYLPGRWERNAWDTSQRLNLHKVSQPPCLIL